MKQEDFRLIFAFLTAFFALRKSNFGKILHVHVSLCRQNVYIQRFSFSIIACHNYIRSEWSIEILRERSKPMNTRYLKTLSAVSIAALFLLSTVFAGTAAAATAEEINMRASNELQTLYNQVNGSRSLVDHAAGILVFPSVVKAGAGIGGEYGEGVLYIGGRPVQYYSAAAGSIGPMLGVESKAVILAFMDKAVLDSFMNSSGWTVGVDGSAALIKVGKSGSVDLSTINKPITGFVLTNNGLMLDASLNGLKFTKIVR